MVAFEGVIVGILLTVAGAFFCVRYRDGRYWVVFGSAFAARLMLIGVQESFTLFGREDIVDYQPYFIEFLEILQNGTFVAFIQKQVGAYTILYPGWLYALLGSGGMWSIRLANAVLSLLIVIPLNEISRRIWGRDLRRWQLVAVLFWPSYIRFSIEVGRTVPTVLFSTWLIATVLTLFETPNRRTVISLALAILATGLLRVHYVFYGVMAAGTIAVHRVLTADDRHTRIGITASAVGLFAIVFAIFDRVIPDVSSFSLSSIRSLARGTARGDSAYLTDVFPETVFDLVWYLPLQGIHFLLAPSPWLVMDLAMPMAVIAGISAWLVVGLLSATLWHRHGQILDDWRLTAVFGSLFLTTIGFGAVTKNAGAAVRWRLPTTLLLLAVTTSLLADEWLSTEIDAEG
ncbi:hypothetical protein [Halosimplex pelagicum]|uniref:Glycosyltransferase family 39 protein n=1 Tax=Halosimplex pelagicum TaxID=869886 RepID=A0A7D5PAN5_9EURY|nr:hypothetical protein [Halosimplex pelagicum]QLH81218.1 hypothetical protein HZS54_05990 [Halosimplex pelagicum]